MAPEGCAGILPIPRSSREHDAVADLQTSRVPAMAECSGPPQPARRDALGTFYPSLEPMDSSPPRSCTPSPMHASTPLILRKSRMRRRARTDLCGGRSVMVVPTATVILTLALMGLCPAWTGPFGSAQGRLRPVPTQELLDEHLVLRDARAVLWMAPFLAEEDFDSGADRAHQSIDLAQRRDHGFVDGIAGLFDSVHGAVQQFIGADDLQPGTIEGIGERGVEAAELIAHQRA